MSTADYIVKNSPDVTVSIYNTVRISPVYTIDSPLKAGYVCVADGDYVRAYDGSPADREIGIASQSHVGGENLHYIAQGDVTAYVVGGVAKDQYLIADATTHYLKKWTAETGVRKIGIAKETVTTTDPTLVAVYIDVQLEPVS